MASEPTDTKLLNEFEAPTRDQWKAAAEALLKGKPFDKVMKTRTPEGIMLEPIYFQGDGKRDSLPGTGDFARGSTPVGYRIEPWDIAQELPYGTAEAFNAALRADLMRGQNAVNLTFDIATQKGMDPDHANVGEVGACGLSIACLHDFEVALREIVPSAVAFYFQNNAVTLPLASLFFAWVRKAEGSLEKLRGSLNFDPLGCLAMSGELQLSPECAFDEMATLTRYVSRVAPDMACAGISSMPYANAGANAVEELACTLATGVTYLRELASRGIEPSIAAQRMCFTFSLGNNFFMELAKLRAARVAWSKVCSAFGVEGSAAAMRIHGRTALWNKSTTDPYVNMLRTTTEALSGAIGGVQSMHVGAFDECIREPDTFSRRIARNTQIILQEECELTSVIDPAGGSWFIENLTDDIGQRGWALFQEIEKQGGMTQALQAGFVQETIAKTRESKLDAVGSRRQGMIGTNLFPNGEETPLDPRRTDYTSIKETRARELYDYRLSNAEAADQAVMEQLNALVAAQGNIDVEAVIKAAASGASLGEIRAALRMGHREPARIDALKSTRASAPYERLRRASDAFRDRTGKRPRIYLTNIGPLKAHKLRMDFTIGFFQTGGFELIAGDGASDPQEAAKMANENGAPITVICGTDDAYVDFVPGFCRAMKTVSPTTKIVLAGAPGENEAAYREAGLDDFIFVKTPNFGKNEAYLKEIGALA